MVDVDHANAIPMEQNHKAYPNITQLTLDMVGYNGGLHRLRTPEIGAEQDVKNKLDECPHAEGFKELVEIQKALDDDNT